jgi:hypothetical protein
MRVKKDDVYFNTTLPWVQREFLKTVTIKYKGDSQSKVCSTCFQFGCSRPGHNTIECRHFIINAHIRAVYNVAKTFPYNRRDDLIEDALASITEVITKHREKLDPTALTAFFN